MAPSHAQSELEGESRALRKTWNDRFDNIWIIEEGVG